MTVDSYSYSPVAADAATSSSPAGSAEAASAKSDFWKDSSGPSFHDLLDAINPLQHIPIIGTIYRWATGDEPGNVARVIGDGIYGGPLGIVGGLFNAVTRDDDGEDLGEQVMAWAFGPGHSKAAPDQGTTAIAEAKPAGAVAETEPASAAAPAAITATELADMTLAPAAAASSTAAIPAAGSTRSVASVAALFRSTDPAARRTSAPAAMANGTADHVPMPLVRSAAAAPAQTVAADPAHELRVQNAMLQRQIAAGRTSPAAGTPQLVNTPVPLQLTGQILPRHQGQAMAVAQQASIVPAAAGVMPPEQMKAATAAPSDPAGAPVAPAAPTDLAVGTPAEISQKMMNALDKYMRMQQERAAAAAAGSQVDVSP